MTAADPRDGHQARLHDLSADMMQAVSECDDIALLGAHVIGFANRLTVLAHARPEAVDSLAADQQKGGGEVVAWEARDPDDGARWVTFSPRERDGWQGLGRTIRPLIYGDSPQPSIPAPAQHELEEARGMVIEANNSLYGSQGYFHSMDGGAYDRHHLARGIEDLKARLRAQQDGKASGGAVAWLRAKADEQDANNARWPEHAKCYPQWQLMPVIARQLAAQLELAHPPHADQETQ